MPRIAPPAVVLAFMTVCSLTPLGVAAQAPPGDSAPRVVASADLSTLLRKASSSGATRILLAGATGATAREAAQRAAAGARVRLQVLSVDVVTGRFVAETERTLDAVFAAAARAGAVLVCEDADALFRGSSDAPGARMTLKRIDAFRGPVLFTLASAPKTIDAAFTRRLHYIVDMRRPEARQRDSLWQSLLPP